MLSAPIAKNWSKLHIHFKIGCRSTLPSMFILCYASDNFCSLPWWVIRVNCSFNSLPASHYRLCTVSCYLSPTFPSLFLHCSILFYGFFLFLDETWFILLPTLLFHSFGESLSRKSHVFLIWACPCIFWI